MYIYIDTCLSTRPETQVSKPFQCDQTWPWPPTPGGLPQPSGSSIRWIAEAGPDGTTLVVVSHFFPL